MGDTGGLRGTGGSSRNFAWQILVRPTQFCPGRAGCGRSPNLADPMPEAWILAPVRPTQKNVGRESSGNAGVDQIWAGGGTFSTPAILPGSSRIWPRPDLARPWVPALFGVKNGSRKKWFCDEIILWWVGRGISMTQMNSIVYKTHLGRQLCPKP